MLFRFFPFLEWFKGYTPDKFRSDAISGLTVALVLIPQSMAYAQLAGLPAYYGLYASFLPPMIASLFGSSRQLATGPVAVVSLMTSASLEPIASAGSEGYIVYAIMLALTVGIFQLLLGILRLGLLVNFLSHPVVNGFTNAAAIIIASSQLSKLFGVYVDKADHHYETILRVCSSALQYTHMPTLIMAILSFAIMYGLRKVNPKIPNVLAAVVITTLISWFIGFEKNMKVNIENIKSQDTVKLIEKFNNKISESSSLSEKRAGLTKELEKSNALGDSISSIDNEYQLALINNRIDELKKETQITRTRLRNLFLCRIKKTDGTVRFGIPENGKSSGGDDSWRIAVGNKALNTAALHFTGGGAVVGVVPEGVPSLIIPDIDLMTFLGLLPYAIIISLLGFMEAISIAKAIAAKTGQRLDPNQELIGQGIANIIGSFGRSYPVSGSFSRSAVNLQAGAVTGFSNVFSSLTVVIVLLFFTPLLYHLPQAVLASIIMMAVIGLINVNGFIHAWRAKWYDGAISIISFIATLYFAPHLDKGIMIGVALSLGVFLYKSMRPTVVSLSRHEDDAFRCSTSHQLAECKYIDLVRFDGSLFFANSSYLEDKINERLINKKDLRHIIIAANGMSDMDASGEETLSLLIERVRSANVRISFSGVNESVMEVLKSTHLLEKIGTDNIFPTMEIAINRVHEQAHFGGDEKDCPLAMVCRTEFHYN